MFALIIICTVHVLAFPIINGSEDGGQQDGNSAHSIWIIGSLFSSRTHAGYSSLVLGSVSFILHMLLLICLFIYFTPVILLFQVFSNISQDLAWYLDRAGCWDSDFEIPPWGSDE